MATPIKKRTKAEAREIEEKRKKAKSKPKDMTGQAGKAARAMKKRHDKMKYT